MHNTKHIAILKKFAPSLIKMQNTFRRACGQPALSILKCWLLNEPFSIRVVICSYGMLADGQHSHLQHNAKSNLRSCRSIMPKNVLASLALQISWCSAAFFIVNLGLKCRKLHWHTSQQTAKCSHAACTPQSLESDQSDTAICASVKVSDYYTVDSSSWICVCGSPLSAPTISLLIKTSIWAPLYPAGSHWSSIRNPPWAKLG